MLISGTHNKNSRQEYTKREKMRKSIFTIAILISLISVVLISCTDDDSPTEPADGSGMYKLVISDKVVAEGTSTNKVLKLGTMVNLGGAGSDFVINITNVPETVGDNNEINLSSGSNHNYSQIKISGNNILGNGEDELFFGKSGVVTRTSETKISFSGTCQPDASGSVVFSFSGFVESDAYKVK